MDSSSDARIDKLDDRVTSLEQGAKDYQQEIRLINYETTMVHIVNQTVQELERENGTLKQTIRNLTNQLAEYETYLRPLINQKEYEEFMKEIKEVKKRYFRFGGLDLARRDAEDLCEKYRSVLETYSWKREEEKFGKGPEWIEQVLPVMRPYFAA
mmetsp:Transcript_24842/g.28362  ORF Transcript_24842/g.28362 Transcript_24842/m.28362 type:complete len:155 (+) Transcript_24842:18-482(+)